MIKLCFLPSHGYPISGLGLPQELNNNEIIKSNRPFLVNPASKHEIIPANSFNLKPEHLEPWKQGCSLSKSSQFVEMNSAVMKPLLIDIHESRPESLVFGVDIGEKYAKQERVMEFLLSRSEELKERGFDVSLLAELMELHAMKSSSQLLPYASSVLFLNQESRKPVMELFRNLMNNPEFSVQSNDQLLFSPSSRAELDDILSIAAEFNLSRNLTRWGQLSPLVPQFQRFESEILMETLWLTPTKLEAVTMAPVESPEKATLKPSPKKHNTKRRVKEKDLYQRNHLHAYESLLSLMIGSDEHKQSTILALQRSGGDLSELLSQCSVTVAGTGIAVLFSVACTVASRRIPFCANKFFETGLGFSLVILSWAVNRLRETLVHVNKKSTVKDGEIVNRVEKSIKEVYIRAATVFAVFTLRFVC